MFLCASTEEKLTLLAKAMTSTKSIRRLRNEKLPSRVIPPQGSSTSFAKFLDVAEDSRGNKPPQQNIRLSDKIETM